MNNRIRVLVVEDSRFMRGVITQILGTDLQIDVVGCAGDGIEAVEAVATLAPDVVTMDVDMPRADGLAAVETIMAQFPTPILMPVRTAKRAATRTEPSAEATWSRNPSDDWRPCVAIAASTGGPAALLAAVPELPRDLAASVVVLQHMPAPYTGQLARELASRSAVAVKEAEDGERLRRGVVYVCPGGHHLSVTAAGRVLLRRAAANLGEAPSADIALASIAQHAPGQGLGVILTGMGRDGAAGAHAIRRSGGIVVAQDEASCVVYGMPQAAIEQGGVDAIVPLSGLVPALLAFVDDLAGIAMRGRGVS